MIVKPPFMSLPELRAAGVPEPWTFGRRDWVRSGEIDSLNHVNNTVYLIWFETVRVGYMHALEPSPYPRLQTVLKSLTAEFHQEMNVNEEYLVTARTSSFRTSSFVQDYAVFSGNLRATGSAITVMLDAETGKKTPLPDSMRRFFVEHDGAEDHGPVTGGT